MKETKENKENLKHEEDKNEVYRRGNSLSDNSDNDSEAGSQDDLDRAEQTLNIGTIQCLKKNFDFYIEKVT